MAVVFFASKLKIAKKKQNLEKKNAIFLSFNAVFELKKTRNIPSRIIPILFSNLDNFQVNIFCFNIAKYFKKYIFKI